MGVPQGCISSSILFNIYINDLIKQIKDIGLNIATYADDVVIRTETDNKRDTTQVFKTKLAEATDKLIT